RGAERTWNSCEIPRSSNSCSAGSIASRSDSEPTRTPTSGPGSPNYSRAANGSVCASVSTLHPPTRDFTTELHPLERDRGAGGVRRFASHLERRTQGGDVEHPSAVREQLASPRRRPGM